MTRRHSASGRFRRVDDDTLVLETFANEERRTVTDGATRTRTRG